MPKSNQSTMIKRSEIVGTMPAAKFEIKKSNAIVLCCNGNWLPYAAVTLKTCAEQGNDCADFFVIVQESEGKDLENFNGFLAATSLTAKVLQVDSQILVHDIQTGRFSKATFLRLFLDEIISHSYELVLYLDCDLIALAPISSIFGLKLNGKSLGAVEDYESLPRLRTAIFSHLRSIGLPKSARYFNAGVLLFDWKKTISNDTLKKTRGRISEVRVLDCWIKMHSI